MNMLNIHYKSIKSALKKIVFSPLEHLINIVVISILASILGGIFLLVQNNDRWHDQNLSFPRITIYLDSNATNSQVDAIKAKINKSWPTLVKKTTFISKEDGLKELNSNKKLKDISSSLVNDSNNPLPNVLIIDTSSADTSLLKDVTAQISTYSQVNSVELDEKYANKVNDLVNFVKKISGFLQILFTFVIALVIYNLVRLQMLLKRDEILVSRLIGASDSFIMRPLAYYAVIQIIFGVIVAYFMLNWFVNFMNNLFLHFSNLFGAGFLLYKLSIFELLQIMIVLIIFTLFAVFMAVRWIFHHTYTQ
jgi:cell division transport system permease protein